MSDIPQHEPHTRPHAAPLVAPFLEFDLSAEVHRLRAETTWSTGDEVTVTLNPVANGRPYGRIAQVVLADGTTLGNLPGNGARGRGAAR